MRDALAPIHTVGAVTHLLNSYSQLLTVAVSHDEGVQVAKTFLGAPLQLKVMQQAAASWEICIASSISDVHAEAVPHGLCQDGPSQAGRQAALLVQNRWLPVRMTAWGKVRTHLDLAQNFLSLANLAMMSEQTSVTRAAGSSHLRREPSFAQLAGANATATVCPSYPWCFTGLCPDPLSWLASHFHRLASFQAAIHAILTAAKTQLTPMLQKGTGNFTPIQSLRTVLKVCSDVLYQAGTLRLRMNRNESHIVTNRSLDGTLSSFLQMVLEAIALVWSALRLDCFSLCKLNHTASACRDREQLPLLCALRSSHMDFPVV